MATYPLPASRLDFGQFDTFADDIADLAFDGLQHARKRRPQRLFHLHDFQCQDRRTLLQLRPNLRQQRHDRPGQRRNNPILADLLLIVAAEWIDPMEFKATIARPQVKLMALNDRHDLRSDPVQREINTPGDTGHGIKADLAPANSKRRGPLAVMQYDFVLASLPLPEREHPLTPANRHPARGCPGRRLLVLGGFDFPMKDRSNGR